MNPCMKHAHYMKAHEWDGWLELRIEDNTYVIPCPHHSPSYLTYKPTFHDTSKLCVNEETEICKKCYEPGCSLSQSHSSDETGDKIE